MNCILCEKEIPDKDWKWYVRVHGKIVCEHCIRLIDSQNGVTYDANYNYERTKYQLSGRRQLTSLGGDTNAIHRWKE